jgi:ligand-binding SRPBCC domain-containing protein
MPAVTIQMAAAEATLHGEQWVPAALERVFAFFSDPHNLERLTPPFLRFRVLEVSTPAIGPGTEIRYRLRLHGLPLTWISRIEAWQPPHGFTDVQIRGPFRLWQHRHEFAAEDGGTRLRDIVRYRVPGARLWRAGLLCWVNGDLRRIFAYRQRAIARLFGSDVR